MKILTVIFLLPLFSFCQQPRVQPLGIGDLVPGITITHLYNYSSPTLRLSDLKGRLVILDFWSTWCGACIESFPKMHRLQQEFGNKVTFILVNPFAHDSPQKVQAFFSRRKATSGLEMTLPYCLGQSLLPGYFPFRFIPHCVWINKDGKVIAITSQTEVTAQNVKKAIDDNAVSLHVKKDMADFSAATPLFVKGNGGSGDDFLYRSLFTRYIEGVGNANGVERNEEGRITRFYMYNAPAMAILRAAYPAEMDYPLNRIIIESRNKSLLESEAAEGSGLYTHSFCYDLSIPPSDITVLQQYLKEDMRRYLGVTVVNEFRKINCLVLTLTVNGTRKYNMDALVRLLNSLPATKLMPVIDSTGITGKMDGDLPANLHDLTLAELKTFLKTCGIEATEAEKIITVAIIK